MRKNSQALESSPVYNWRDCLTLTCTLIQSNPHLYLCTIKPLLVPLYNQTLTCTFVQSPPATHLPCTISPLTRSSTTASFSPLVGIRPCQPLMRIPMRRDSPAARCICICVFLSLSLWDSLAHFCARKNELYLFCILRIFFWSMDWLAGTKALLGRLPFVKRRSSQGSDNRQLCRRATGGRWMKIFCGREIQKWLGNQNWVGNQNWAGNQI